ncbi:hypothetical protein ACHAW6_003556 [Cyclotella cf. meneghiniana]
MKTSSSSSPPSQDHVYPGESQPQASVASTEPASHVAARPPPPPLLHSGSGSYSDAPVRQIAPPRRTDHTYHDYATHSPSPYDYPVTKKSTSNFPAKLHRMISDPTNSQAIQWQPHGRAWRVIDKDLLVEVVIPKYFVQTKYESFTRQLSGWGFKRLHQTGPDYRCYYHECFLRGLPHLTRFMKRTEPNQGKLLPHVEAEPDFHQMDLIHPLPPSYVYPLPPVNTPAGAAATGAYPYPHGGHAPYWPPSNVPADAQPYPYGHYHGQAPAPPGTYPPPPPYDPYGYPYPHPPPHQPFEQYPMYPPQGQDHMMGLPYHAGYPAAGLSPQLYPPYGQHLHGYADKYTYSMHPSNPNEVDPHLVVNQNHPSHNIDVYSNQEQPSHNANVSNNDNEASEGLSQQHH